MVSNNAMTNRLLAGVGAAIAAALLVSACGGSDAPESASAAAPTIAEQPATGDSVERSETVAEFLQRSGISATPILPGADAPLTAEIDVPEGWQAPETVEDEVPDAYRVLVGEQWRGDGFVPLAVLKVSELSGPVDPDELLARAPGELENLPLFGYGPDTSEEISGYPAYGLNGSYFDEKLASMTITKLTVVVDAQTKPYLVELTVNGLAKDSDSMAGSVRAMMESLAITPR
jgi:hypothetical protein